MPKYTHIQGRSQGGRLPQGPGPQWVGGDMPREKLIWSQSLLNSL